MNSPTFGLAVRAKWSEENRRHGLLDVVLHDGPMHLAPSHGKAMAAVRVMAMDFMRDVTGKNNQKSRRKAAALMHDCLRNPSPPRSRGL